MSLPIPHLDDQNYQDLIQEARALIPIYHKEWTNHNPSDPGIVLLELFAWLSEMALYRVNQIPNETYRQFIELLGVEFEPETTLETGIQKVLQELNRRYRAITKEDFEELTLECVAQSEPGLKCRAICIPNRNLSIANANLNKPGHVSVILLTPTRDYQPSAELKQQVMAFLNQRKLITTRVHVVGPITKDVRLRIDVKLKRIVGVTEIVKQIEEKIRKYFDLIEGGVAGKGWPMGRDLYRSEIYSLVENIPEIDHVSRIAIDPDNLPIADYQLLRVANQDDEPIINLTEVNYE